MVLYGWQPLLSDAAEYYMDRETFGLDAADDGNNLNLYCSVFLKHVWQSPDTLYISMWILKISVKLEFCQMSDSF